eukprot:CAMPEP_0117006954 /NCGR_PEP_ID=MMETSP0472-20121206/7000_1 /TAXON_ID=693140 ORGANISM="Tiarina fusus, Strain LIS" /NCGR_SAMPLE_ID=MMETSP0472 /ASSEMBLY_ACC=CAM_ASM_000603 /LENGTH=279 /DNA_ID=CAMNT_0004708571 /DNA_START=277 /DNA_END=1113 /DNA_ORIENTATION=-
MAKHNQALFEEDNEFRLPVVLHRSELAPSVRYCSWNIQWMDWFFQDDKTILQSNLKQSLTDVPTLCTKIGQAIEEIDPDVLTVLEGPRALKRMKLFQRTFLDNKFDCFGGIDGGSQRTYILIKKNSVVRNPCVFEEANDFLSQPWHYSIDGSLQLTEYNFSRRPVAVRAEVEIDSKMEPIFFFGVHIKSKHVTNGEAMWKNGTNAEKEEFILESIRNRRKIAAECGRLRKCLTEVVFEKNTNPMIIVSGDMNDGPGMDFFQDHYLLFDSVNLLTGNTFH